MADVRLTATNPDDSSVVPVACDASGRLLLEEMPPAFDGTVDGDLTVSGKGTFAGGKSIIGNDGSAQFAQGAVDIYANGTVEFTQSVNFDSAEFAGEVNAGNRNPSSTTSVGTRIAIDGSVSGVYTQALPSVGSSANAFQALSGNNEVFKVSYDGSAEFAGKVDVGSSTHNTHAFTAANNSDNGTILAANHSGGKAIVCRSPDIVGGNTDTIALYADGTAKFAGNKAGFTKEGYLWCTTRRGDTVILDATSNGLASWAEYTPTSRIEEIRDKLDSNRGDTGEMPADTQ